MTLGLPPEAWDAVFLSLRVALVATALSLPLAIWLAHLLARRDFPGKALLNALIVLPLVLPPVVTGYLLLELFGTQGAIGRALESVGIVLAFRWTGAVLAAAHHAAHEPAVDHCGRGAGFCQSDGRVRRNHHLRRRHPRRDADGAIGDLCFAASAGRGGRCGAVGAGFGGDRGGGGGGV